MARNRFTSIAAALALAAGSAGLIACGDDKESSTSADSTAATTTSEPAQVTETPDSGSFAAATAALESAGFSVEQKPDSELTQTAGLKKPITATAGAVVTKSGESGDLLLFEFESEDEAAEYAAANSNDISQSELLDTIVIVGTTSNEEMLDAALEAVGN